MWWFNSSMISLSDVIFKLFASPSKVPEDLLNFRPGWIPSFLISG